MPTLDFKGKQHIYAHHLTVPYRPIVPEKAAPAIPPVPTTTSSSTATTYTPSKHYYPATRTVSSASTLIHPTTPATRHGSITTT